MKETALLPDFLTDIFCGLLGYSRPTDGSDTFTLSREQHVEVDGKFADAVLGRFGSDQSEVIVALEGKGTRDPLDRPFAGRKMSAVDQAYRYAINLPCECAFPLLARLPPATSFSPEPRRSHASAHYGKSRAFLAGGLLYRD